MVGHEIVGVAVRVGSKAEGNIQVGDIVGVGAQGDSCLSRDGPCEACDSQDEIYCPRTVQTYASRHFNGDQSFGGYATYHRAASHFVFKIPAGLAPEAAAPMLCAGSTVYSPLKEYGAAPGKKIGVIGIGGLGHFAILFGKAMGATMVGISRTKAKKEDTMALGADEFISTDDDPDWLKNNAGKFDFIISTAASTKVRATTSRPSDRRTGTDKSPQMPLTEYLLLLKTRGTLVQLGGPEGPVPLGMYPLIYGKRSLTSSLVGSPDEIREMLQLAADKQIKPWVELRKMEEANQAIVDMEDGKARFRYVLTN